MTDMISFQPKQLPAYIKVIGVGGGGSNAVNHMYTQGIAGVDFVVCNTDVQALESSPVPIKVVLGERMLGAGSKPEVGRDAALASIDTIKDAIKDDTQMLFITAGMGGGTGTGAAPVIAEVAREMGILTVAIVTIPFSFEGRRRMKQAEEGIAEIKKHVDTLLVICNDKLRLLYGDVTLTNAFARADDVLTSAAKGIAELITVPGYVNIDFEDVKTVIENSGKAIMGSATAEGEGRARQAIEEAMSSPLLNDNDIKGAKNILLYIMTGNEEIKMDEITEITEYVHQECGGDFDADVIWGNGRDENLENKIGITIIATGFETQKKKDVNKIVYNLGEDKTETEKETKAETETENTEEEPITFKSVRISEEEEEDIESESSLKLIKKSDPTDTVTPENKTVYQLDDEIGQQEKATNVKDKVEETSIFTHDEKSRLSIKHTISSDTLKTEKEEKDESSDSSEESVLEKNAARRSELLKKLSMIRPEEIDDYEREPAYIRKQLDLDQSAPSSDSVVSKYTLGEDSKNNPIIKSDNSFLHDNVD
jgi:cell division protein FtsZ